MVVLSGHLEPVVELQWRPAEGMLCCRCARAGSSESSLYIWQVPSGRRERLLSQIRQPAPPFPCRRERLPSQIRQPAPPFPCRLERELSGVDALPHLSAMARGPLCQNVPDITPNRELRSGSRLLDHVRLSLGASNPHLDVVRRMSRGALHATRCAACASPGACASRHVIRCMCLTSRGVLHVQCTKSCRE